MKTTLITAYGGTDLDLSEKEIRERERQGEQSNPENETIARSSRPTWGIKPMF